MYVIFGELAACLMAGSVGSLLTIRWFTKQEQPSKPKQIGFKLPHQQ